MVFLAFSVVLFATYPALGGLINPGTPGGVPHSFDCTVRQFAYEYGKKLQSRHGDFSHLADALQVFTCNDSSPLSSPQTDRTRSTWKPPFVPRRDDKSCTVFVDKMRGKDTNDGSITSPVATLRTALHLIPILRREISEFKKTECTIYLREGTHYVTKPIVLNSKHSRITIRNFEGERATVSGGVSMDGAELNWKPFKQSKLKSVVYENMNNVYGRAQPGKNAIDTIYLGKFNTADECATTAYNTKNATIRSWTWHSLKINAPYTGECFGVISDVWAPVSQMNVVSGRMEFVNIWATSVPDSVASDGGILGLRVNGKRAIRARYPNGNPETSMQWQPLQDWIRAKTTWKSPTPKPAPKEVIINGTDYPDVEWPKTIPGGSTRWSGDGDAGDYHVGIGGTCGGDGLDPPFGYWCAAHPPRDMGGGLTHRHPSGLMYNKTLLPNSPYADARGGIIHAWRPAHWFTVQFEIGSDSGTEFSFSRGGYQGGEGFNYGGEWYIENVMEELDSPMEWFYNPTTKMLYYFHNDSSLAPPPSDLKLVGVKQQILMSLMGNQSDPIVGVTIDGIEFADAAYTFMETHGLPSGGDWALERMGAIRLEGTINTTISNCLFNRLDGNGISINGFNRYMVIQTNNFEWLGANAMAAWGYSSSKRPDFPKTEGPDGRNGDQPRHTLVEGNMVREIGIYQKQSSMWFQAVSCQTVLKGNIFFNGPRAGINFNDGFGGANEIVNNLLINAVRESGDHGPFNSWDRVPYITTVGTGKPSVIPATNLIHLNFVIGTYQTQEAIDTDDGSSYDDVFQNFFVYGGNGLKSDFNGHDHRDFENIYAYIGRAFGGGVNDAFFSNRAVLSGNGGYPSSCSKTYGFNDSTIHNNSIYNSAGTLNVCGTTLKNWVAQGHDVGTTVSKYPTDATIIQWAKELLP